jgi:3-oxoacyl-[acyl-carrier protein] reductase
VSTFDGRVALVTGASRGIGYAVGLALARAGAQVLGTATRQEGADRFAAALGSEGLPGAGMVLDVNAASQVERVLDAIQKSHGDVVILVNNAGITRDNLLMRMKEEEWDDIMSTNLKSVYRLSKAVVRGMMKARYGRIVNITSVIGAMGNAGQTNYAAAKAGVAGFTRALAREVGSRNITVNCVAPGFIDTDMTRAMNDAQRTAITQQIPLGRLGHVDDVASAVVFLASDAASYITGCTLHVNGGMHME